MMAALAGNDAISAPVEQKAPEKKPWTQLDGESRLWHNRFKLYKALGPKRTLLAALAKEQESIRALKGTETETKPSVSASTRPKTSEKGRRSQMSTLTPLPKATPAQVPGSWKRASIQIAWVERALAYDEWVIDRAVEQHLLEELNGLGRKGQRIGTLKLIAEALCKQLNAAGEGDGMKYEHYCLLIARLQSVLRDIRDETQDYDESIERLLLTKEVRILYAENKIQPKPKPKEK